MNALGRMVMLFVITVCSSVYADHNDPVIARENEPIVVKLDLPKASEGDKVQTNVRWRTANPKLVIRIPTDGTLVYGWAPPGQYVLSGVVTSVNWTKQNYVQEDHDVTIIVQALNPTPLPPNPNPPGPNPPGPAPAPASQFKAAVQIGYLSLPASARDAIIQQTHGDGHVTEKPARQMIAENYLSIADAASIPNAYDPATMMSELKTRHASTLPVVTLREWKPFFDAVAKAFVADKIPADDTATHVKRFREVADVLTK